MISRLTRANYRAAITAVLVTVTATACTGEPAASPVGPPATASTPSATPSRPMPLPRITSLTRAQADRALLTTTDIPNSQTGAPAPDTAGQIAIRPAVCQPMEIIPRPPGRLSQGLLFINREPAATVLSSVGLVDHQAALTIDKVASVVDRCHVVTVTVGSGRAQAQRVEQRPVRNTGDRTLALRLDLADSPMTADFAAVAIGRAYVTLLILSPKPLPDDELDQAIVRAASRLADAATR